MVDELYGAGGGGGKGGGDEGRTPQEAPNTLRSASTARIVDVLGEGEIVGLVDGLKSIYLDNTALQSASGSFNFSGVNVETRNGTPAQTYVSGFPAVEREVDVSTQVKAILPIVRTVSNQDVDAVRIKIRVPALSFQDVNTGDINGTSVSVAIDVSDNGAPYVQATTVDISGKTTSPYERQVRIELGGTGPWDIRLRRLTADSESSTLQNNTFWASYTELIDAKLAYPDTAYVALTIDARQFGSSIPERSYDVKGRIIRVPSNYNPVTREYTGLWDGTFQLAWTDNPAWVFMDLATHPRYGAGIDNVDKWALYQIAQYCDEMVEDGYGGMEPRYSINTVIGEQQDSVNALSQMASVFRGIVFWGSNAALAVADMPTDPVKLVTPANVIDGNFEYTGSSLRDRHSVVAVTWNDPEDNYSKQVELVEDQDLIQVLGWRQVDVSAFGCTSRGQAARLGKWLLYTERYETEILTYRAGIDHADLRPGDIIAVHDPDIAGARLGGRIRVTGDTVLTLDKIPDSINGSTWYLDAMLPDGVIQRREVASFAGDQVTLVSPLDAVPIVGAMWMLSSVSVEPRLFRVSTVAESEELIYSISAVEYDPAKYDYVEKGLALPERDFSLVPTGPIPAPISLSVAEYLYQSGGGILSGAYLSIEPPADPRVSLYEAQVLRPGDAEFSHLGTHSTVTVNVLNTIAGAYTFRVRSLTASGARSDWRTLSIGLQALLRPPGDVIDLKVTTKAGQIQLEWTPLTDLDLSHYEIRFSPSTSGAIWSSAQVIASTVPRGTATYTLPARRGTYFIKGVDTSGVYSLNAGAATSEIAGLDQYNVVEIIEEAPGWIGVKDRTEEAGGNLQLASADTLSDWTSLSAVPRLSYGFVGLEPEGYYYADEIVDMGGIYSARISGSVIASGFNILNTINGWLTLASVLKLDDTENDQWSVRVDISQSVTPAPAAPTDWSPWEPLNIGEYTARAFRFRLYLQSDAPSITPLVDSMNVVVDMPDRVAGENNLVCPAAGFRVTFSPAFFTRPSIAIDGQDMVSGDWKTITNADETGFDLQFFNSSSVAVERTFDYLAKGYGIKQ